MASVLDLQKEVNRFAADPNIGFEPIKCDGVMGPNTLAATLLALTTVNLASPDPFAQGLAGGWIDALNTPGDLTTNLDAVLQVLTDGGNTLGFTYITCPTGLRVATSTSKTMPKPTGAAGAAALAKLRADKPALSAGLLGLGLPNWAVYGGGAALALGFVALIIKRKKLSASQA